MKFKIATKSNKKFIFSSWSACWAVLCGMLAWTCSAHIHSGKWPFIVHVQVYVPQQPQKSVSLWFSFYLLLSKMAFVNYILQKWVLPGGFRYYLLEINFVLVWQRFLFFVICTQKTTQRKSSQDCNQCTYQCGILDKVIIIVHWWLIGTIALFWLIARKLFILFKTWPLYLFDCRWLFC